MTGHMHPQASNYVAVDRAQLVREGLGLVQGQTTAAHLHSSMVTCAQRSTT